MTPMGACISIRCQKCGVVGDVGPSCLGCHENYRIEMHERCSRMGTATDWEEPADPADDDRCYNIRANPNRGYDYLTPRQKAKLGMTQ